MAFAGRFCPIALVSDLGRNWGPFVSGLQRPFTAGERIEPEAGTAASDVQYRGAGLWCWFLSVLGWTLASDAKGLFIRSCRLVDLWRVHIVERHLAYGRSHARTIWRRHDKFACTDLVSNRTAGAERFKHSVFHHGVCQSLNVLIFMAEFHRF